MNTFRIWLLRIALLLPAAAVVAAAYPRLVSGMALEAAFPYTAYLEMNVFLSPASYAYIARILAHSPPADGETQILRAEAAVDAGEPIATTIAITKSGLAHAPCSARGWILLAALLSNNDPKDAVAALSLAIELAPREYYLIGPRAVVGAALWKFLPGETRARLIEDARLLATESALRDQLRILLGAKGGSALVTRAFANNPEQLREINRSLARERLNL
jgi:hypothetical protein